MFEAILPEARFLATAPGRVNLLGEHVDYNGGAVLPAAIDRAVRLKAAPRSDRLVNLTALDLGQSVTFSLDALDQKVDTNGQPLPGWACYPAGVAWALQAHGLQTLGMDAAFTSNVPMGAGLSSSAAVEVAFAALWQKMSSWAGDGMLLARLSQQAENRYVGVNCGLMDQFASANGVEGHALYFDTRSLEWKPVPLPKGAALVIANSRTERKLTSSGYNERRAACEEAVRLLQPFLPQISALRDVQPAQFDALARHLPDLVARRARYVVEECARMDEAVCRLNAEDGRGFGQLMFETHTGLRDLYEVSTPELNVLVSLARSLPGCWGARLTGAGFGGCTVNLVADENVEEFIPRLKEGYTRALGREAEVYLCHASQGAHVQTL